MSSAVDLRPAFTDLPARSEAELQHIDTAARWEDHEDGRANTKRAYGKDLEMWLAFCTEKRERPDVVTEGLLAAYAKWLCEQRMPATDTHPDGQPYSVATLKRRLYGAVAMLRTWLGPNVVPKGLTALAINAIKRHDHRLRVAAVKTGRGKAPALWVDQVLQAVGHIDLTTTIGVRDYAMILMWYFLGSRRSEIAALNFDDVTEDPYGRGLSVRIRASKAGQPHDPIVPHEFHEPDTACVALCPVAAWYEWVLAAGLTGGGRAFRQVDRHGNVKDVGFSGHAAHERIKLRCKQAGLDIDVTGHSVRRGHISTAVDNGCSEAEIIVQTGHATGSRQVQQYVQLRDRWRNSSAKGLMSNQRKPA